MQTDVDFLIEEYNHYRRLRFEQDGRQPSQVTEDAAVLKEQIEILKGSEVPDSGEPSVKSEIVKQCAFSELKKLEVKDYAQRIKGAVCGRFAGCTLGVPVEGYQLETMAQIATESGMDFPPTDYWKKVLNPDGVQYGIDTRDKYVRGNIVGVPVDDDITYTVLNMLLLEMYGAKYSTEDVADLWLKVLPYGCTAEDRALKVLWAGGKASEAAEDNPFVEWIGAAIRGDAFGYVFAGDPQKAATAAINDAYLTHRRNGIYGEMFTAATVSAAFGTSNVLEAARIGSKCIPQNSRLARDLKWAFDCEGKYHDFIEARALLDERFAGMSSVHTNNNMCAVVFALTLGKNDFTATISNSVAMGLDNDCNAATVGSIVGANKGIDNIPKYWYAPFGDEVRSYLKGYSVVGLSDIIERLIKMKKLFGEE